MRLALSTTAALVLVPVARPWRLQRRRESRLLPRGSMSAAFSYAENDGQIPIWKQSNYQHVAGVKPCDPRLEISAAGNEPDVGILAKCAPGYSCRALSEDSDFGAFGGGMCVANDDDGMTQVLRRELQNQDLCELYQSYYGTCDCSNWSNGAGNFNCDVPFGNTTFFGFPFRAAGLVQVTSESSGGEQVATQQFCYESLDSQATIAIQSYCITEYATYLQSGQPPSEQSCAVTMNGQECNVCTMAPCNNSTDILQYVDSFDCSNVDSSAIVEDVCGGNTIWRQLLGDEFPTSEPTAFPTFEPTVFAPVIDTTPPGNGNPQPSTGEESEQPVSAGNPPSGSDSPSPDGSSASARSIAPLAVSALLTLATVWN